MTTYYQDGEVRVTDRAVEVGTRVFPIVELSFVWHEKRPPPLRAASRRLGRFGLIASLTVPMVIGIVILIGLVVAAVIVIPLVAVANRSLLVPIIVAVAVVVGLGLVLAMLAVPASEYPMMALERSYDRGTEVREIWVRWRERDLVLLRTADAARFGKIYRAIQRAVERDEG